MDRAQSVLSIECLKGSSKADEWTGDMLQTGDIVEEIKIGSSSGSRSRSVLTYTSPFKNGRSGVQKILDNAFKDKLTSILVRIRRGDDEFVELQACIVPECGSKKHYALRSISDPNYAVGFSDRTEAQCLELQASTSSRMISALSRSKLQDGYVSYPWGRRMHESLTVPNSSSFLSLLLLPKASDQISSRYNDLEDTLARANAWLNASQAAGVPIVFVNIQTESLLTKISGETASSTVSTGSLSDLSNLANASLYGFEDYHGVDIGVVRAVRLWYAPLVGEFPIEITINEGDSKLGFAIGRINEGFIYISSVMDNEENLPSSRSGLNNLYKEAVCSSKLLVVSRISNEKVLPWIVSSTGAIRCFDTVSLSQKLSLHRHAKVAIILHVFLWDQKLATMTGASTRSITRVVSSFVQPMQAQVRLARPVNDNQVLPLPCEELFESEDLQDEPEFRRDGDGDTVAGEGSFRFHRKNWL